MAWGIKYQNLTRDRHDVLWTGNIQEEGFLTTIIYGFLYNWYAATDVREIANIGWHVPTSANYDTLIAYLGGLDIAGGKLKEIGLIYWETPNTGATNEVGFNGRGAGMRLEDGTFEGFKIVVAFRTTTIPVPGWDSSYQLLWNTAAVNSSTSLFLMRGLSIRLIKDSTILTHGQTGTYIGNDGKAYRTICIGTQEWLADNLAETKYRNGDIIPEVTDNAAWAALTTGALCAYDNNWENV